MVLSFLMDVCGARAQNRALARVRTRTQAPSPRPHHHFIKVIVREITCPPASRRTTYTPVARPSMRTGT